MEQIAEYVLSVTGAVIISAAALRLLDGKGSAAAVGKMITGIFLALTVIAPMTQVRLSDVLEVVPDLSADAMDAVEMGEAAAQKALAESISTQLEAYILDKAAQFGVTLEVEVELSTDQIPVPIRVRLRGNVSPYAKARLQSILRDDLGIEKENQLWT